MLGYSRSIAFSFGSFVFLELCSALTRKHVVLLSVFSSPVHQGERASKMHASVMHSAFAFCGYVELTGNPSSLLFETVPPPLPFGALFMFCSNDSVVVFLFDPVFGPD